MRSELIGLLRHDVGIAAGSAGRGNDRRPRERGNQLECRAFQPRSVCWRTLRVAVPWGELAYGLLVPTVSADPAFWTTVVAVLGTTISPYLFFWQASQEVEDLRADSHARPLVKAPLQAPAELERIRLDTYLGMAFSNLVALAIIVTTAATLHANGLTKIETSAQAASALRPVAGPFAFT